VNLAVIAPKRLGDSIFHTPIVSHLRRCLPDVLIDILALTPTSGEVFRGNPNVRRVIVAPDATRLRELSGQYEWVIGCYATDTANVYARALHAPREVLTRVRGTGHMSQVILQTVCTAMGLPMPDGVSPYELHPSDGDVRSVAETLASLGVEIGAQPLVGLHPGCRSLSKRRWKFWQRMEHEKAWSSDQLVTYVRELVARAPGVRIVVTGTRGEQRLFRAVERAVGPAAVSMLDRTSVAQLAALMGFLSCYVVPDTGALHVASSTDVPLIGLFGPTNPLATGPYPGRENYTPVVRPCMSDIAVEDVLAPLSPTCTRHRERCAHHRKPIHGNPVPASTPPRQPEALRSGGWNPRGAASIPGMAAWSRSAPPACIPGL
jgi:ADP-heptose:LPS heptosyltransferase